MAWDEGSGVETRPRRKAYYHRKVAEGKNPMSVLNAVRFKLICQIFSVVKRDQEFVKEYRKIAA